MKCVFKYQIFDHKLNTLVIIFTHTVKVVNRCSETQLHVAENLITLTQRDEGETLNYLI